MSDFVEPASEFLKLKVRHIVLVQAHMELRRLTNLITRLNYVRKLEYLLRGK